jgi:hypothetical protein
MESDNRKAERRALTSGHGLSCYGTRLMNVAVLGQLFENCHESQMASGAPSRAAISNLRRFEVRAGVVVST